MKRYRLILMQFATAAAIAVSSAAAGAGQSPSPDSPIPADRGVFTATGSMAFPDRDGPTATLLGDGRVLVIGGGGTMDGGPVLAELWDPANGRFSPAGALHGPRGRHTATLLPDGRVLVVGGFAYDYEVADLRVYPGPELWDPVTLRFSESEAALSCPTPDPALDELPTDTTAVVQANGRVLVTCVDGAGHAVAAAVWDPETDTASSEEPASGIRHVRDGTVLADGRVLITGGFGDDGVVATASIWDPVTDALTPTGTLGVARSGHAAALLTDGRVLVTGGRATNPQCTPNADAVASTTARSDVPIGDRGGGRVTDVGFGSVAIACTEIWDPLTGLFGPTGPMLRSREGHAALLLPDGRVLIVGGRHQIDGDPAEIFELR